MVASSGARMYAADLDAATAETAKPPSFVNDIVPLLTRFGCNQGACHGKNDGRNGFKLSLRGYAPEWDYERLTRESRSRRLNLAYPEQSLILLKASGRVAHGGGTLIEADSRAYRLLLDWIRGGAPGAMGDEPRVEAVMLSPGDQTLAVGEQRQMTVAARYSDGEERDVTWLTQFFTNDASVVAITPGGEVTAKRQGETAIRAHFQGQVAVAVMTVPYDKAAEASLYAERRNLVDEHVFAKLEALRIPVSPGTTDHAFVRRVYLDTIGTLPTADEIRAFVGSTDGDKRAKLIDDLLSRAEYVDYWTLQLADLLQNRRERDGDVRGAKGVRAMHVWIRAQVAQNRPWNELARDVMTASGDTSSRPEIGYYVVTVGAKEHADQTEIVASVAQSFLGTRIGCAQCHNHPLEKFTQDDYYHFAAFFAPVRLKRQDSKNGATALSIVNLDGDGERRRKLGEGDAAKERIGVVQPRTGRFIEPKTLDGKECEAAPGDDPRAKLAAWMTDGTNEAFAGSMVNRVWRHYLGVGLVEPVDDLRSSNPPSNPELWRALVKDFVANRFDLKHLTRLILNSRTYQLSSATVKGNESDTRFYSHYMARRLPAEVLLDAISQATERPEPFAGYPLGVRAIQIAEPGLESYFLTQFGRSERVTACACERRGEVNIAQLLQLQNGAGVLEKIKHGEGRLHRLLTAQKNAQSNDDGPIFDELFLATLSREPKAEELVVIRGELISAENREEALSDLFWALINSKEFAFNH